MLLNDSALSDYLSSIYLGNHEVTTFELKHSFVERAGSQADWESNTDFAILCGTNS